MIRHATIQDIQALYKLTKYALGYNDLEFDDFVPRVDMIMDDKKHIIFVYEYENKVVGYIHLQYYITLNLDPYVEVLELCVDENYRGLGIGKKLLLKAEQWTKENHKKGIRLGSNAIRVKAHEFYKHLGYVNYKDHKIFKKEL